MKLTKRDDFSSRAKLAIRIGVSATLLVLVFWKIPIQSVWETLVQIDLPLGMLAVSLALVSPLVGAQQIRLVLAVPGVPLHFGSILAINLKVKFYSLFLPGYLSGGVLRWYYLSKDNRKRAEVAAAIGFNRMMEISILCAVGAVCFALYNDPRLMKFIPIVVFAAIVPFLFFATAWNLKFLQICRRALQSRICPDWLAIRLDKVLGALEEFPHARAGDLTVIVLICVLRHLLNLLWTFLLARALGIDVSILMLAFLRLCVELLLMLPVSLSGLGIRELSYVVLLGLVAVPAEAAVALGLAKYSIGLLVALLGGGLEFHDHFFKRYLFRRADERP